MKKILFILVLIFTSCSESNNWYKLELEKENSKIQFPSKPIEKFETRKNNGIELPVKIFIYQAENKKCKKSSLHIWNYNLSRFTNNRT